MMWYGRNSAEVYILRHEGTADGRAVDEEMTFATGKTFGQEIILN